MRSGSGSTTPRPRKRRSTTATTMVGPESPGCGLPARVDHRGARPSAHPRRRGRRNRGEAWQQSRHARSDIEPRSLKKGKDAVIRETVISESTHRVQQCSIYTEGRKPLANAVITGPYRIHQLPPGEDGSTSSVFLPEKFRLTWVEENLTLDVDLRDVAVNPTFTAEKRAALFIEPKLLDGYTRVNLAERAGIATKGPTTIRETRPVPPPARVELRAPAPAAIDDEVKPTARPRVALRRGPRRWARQIDGASRRSQASHRSRARLPRARIVELEESRRSRVRTVSKRPPRRAAPLPDRGLGLRSR